MSEPTSVTRPTHIHTVWRKRKLSTARNVFSKVTGNPEKKLDKLIMKHKIYWNSKWDDKLRLTIELPSNKSPEETVAEFCALMQDEGLDKYWEYVTQAHTDDPRKVHPRVYKNDQELQEEELTNKS
ncbi:hypothetical protein FPANT_10965 [Fusarium pseudoanthophilum]|uniref:Uncharacterized protein n=1 Tax=Fusarium pseudoanthophilum TaxID=48495 RepID=A0A8H5NUJ5_9HYPO|nr:hypothetical protein FPANT_10965 [Fusarium pseudoanthophilum]